MAEDQAGAQGWQRARLIIEVTAGVVPGKPMAELTRKWALTEQDWEMDQSDDAERRCGAMDKWDTVHGASREYAARLMNPGQINWVRLDWLWL